MKTLLTTLLALLFSVGLVSCASDEEKMEEQRQEEIREAEAERDKLEKEAAEARAEADAMKQEQEESMAHSSDKPWANQQYTRDDVRKVQSELNSKGHDSGSVDGLIGPNTTAGIKSFQEANDLNASGDLNSETIDALGLDIQKFSE